MPMPMNRPDPLQGSARPEGRPARLLGEEEVDTLAEENGAEEDTGEWKLEDDPAPQ